MTMMMVLMMIPPITIMTTDYDSYVVSSYSYTYGYSNPFNMYEWSIHLITIQNVYTHWFFNADGMYFREHYDDFLCMGLFWCEITSEQIGNCSCYFMQKSAKHYHMGIQFDIIKFVVHAKICLNRSKYTFLVFLPKLGGSTNLLSLVLDHSLSRSENLYQVHNYIALWNLIASPNVFFIIARPFSCNSSLVLVKIERLHSFTAIHHQPRL